MYDIMNQSSKNEIRRINQVNRNRVHSAHFTHDQ